ncbi:MAG: hypothetical protein ACYTF0_01465, partial [Planctomycetota bacterium]
IGSRADVVAADFAAASRLQLTLTSFQRRDQHFIATATWQLTSPDRVITHGQVEHAAGIDSNDISAIASAAGSALNHIASATLEAALTK